MSAVDAPLASTQRINLGPSGETRAIFLVHARPITLGLMQTDVQCDIASHPFGGTAHSLHADRVGKVLVVLPSTPGAAQAR
jgi:hypothetical protein